MNIGVKNAGYGKMKVGEAKVNTGNRKKGTWIKRNPTTFKVILYIAIALIIIAVSKKIIKNIQKSKAEKLMGKDDAVSQAQALRIAFNPSGIGWLSSLDTTSTSTMYKIAEKIADIDEVAKQYKRLYSRSMYDDLEKELSASEYEKFMRIARKEVGTGGTPSITGFFETPNLSIFTKNDVIVRSSAEKDTGFFGIGHNMLYKAPTHKVIGVTTGYQSMDYDNDVLYTQCRTMDKDKVKKIVWVAKSSIIVDTSANIKAKYGDVKFYYYNKSWF